MKLYSFILLYTYYNYYAYYLQTKQALNVAFGVIYKTKTS